jgi:adenylate cyclase class 2
MREIEVKARLRAKEDLFKKAATLGITFNEPVIQEDVTYETLLSKGDPAWNIFRIRKQGENTILTMKYKASTRSRDNHERETLVENATEVVDMLERLGYSYGVRIKKTRQVAKYNELEICVDEIDGLGWFVEIEKLASDDASVDEIQDELWIILQKLGVSPDDRVHKGYDTLMHELLGSAK